MFKHVRDTINIIFLTTSLSELSDMLQSGWVFLGPTARCFKIPFHYDFMGDPHLLSL